MTAAQKYAKKYGVPASLVPLAQKVERFLRQRGSPLADHAGEIVRSANRYYPRNPGLLAGYVVGISGGEQTYGTTGNADVTQYHNAWGYGHPPSGITSRGMFSSWGQGIDTVSRALATDYLGQGLTTPGTMYGRWVKGDEVSTAKRGGYSAPWISTVQGALTAFGASPGAAPTAAPIALLPPRPVAPMPTTPTMPAGPNPLDQYPLLTLQSIAAGRYRPSDNLAMLQELQQMPQPQATTPTFSLPTTPNFQTPPAAAPTVKAGPFKAVDLTAFAVTHGAQTPTRIVLHDTESTGSGSGYAKGIADYWRRQGKGYGVHLIIANDGTVSRLAADNQVAYHVGGANDGSLGIEIAGMEKWSRAQWLAHPKQLENVAKAIGYWSAKYGIPIVLDADKGVSTHAMQSARYAASEGHTDPGPGFPLEAVLAKAKRYAASYGTAPAATPAAPAAGKVTMSAGADRPGMRTHREVIDFVSLIAGVYGKPLTIGTGTNHNQYVAGTDHHESHHWTGWAADIPMAGAALTRLGQAALVAAGMKPAEARKQKGGVYNIGRYNILFNTRVGGNHWNHLHVGLRT